MSFTNANIPVREYKFTVYKVRQSPENETPPLPVLTFLQCGDISLAVTSSSPRGQVR